MLLIDERCLDGDRRGFQRCRFLLPGRIADAFARPRCADWRSAAASNLLM